MKKTIAAALLLTLLLVSVSCSDSQTTTETTSVTEAAGTTQTDPVVTDGIEDSLPDDLNFNGTKVRISVNGEPTVAVYEVGTNQAEGEIVSDALYNRNLAVEERLNIQLDYIFGPEVTTAYRDYLRTVLTAGDDAYDILITHQSFGLPQSLDGLYHNLSDAPYLDYSQPWWDVNYMSKIEINDNSRYLLGGDICMFLLRNMGSVFFNKTMYQNYYGDPNELYELTMNGQWTIEKLQQFSTEVYNDLNQNGEIDRDDTLGFYINTISHADLMAYSAGMTISERDSSGKIQLIEDQTRNVDIIDKLKRLYYETEGVFVTPDPADQLTVGVQTFSNGKLLFFPERFSRLHALRDMEDPYGILPYPKADESQKEYSTMIHDYATLYAVPITLSEIDMSCAVLEAMCIENHKNVMPTYYEVALKVKYSHDDISAQVIDLIRSNAPTDFMYANNYYFTSGQVGMIQRTVLTKNGEYMSTYAAMEKGAKKLLEELWDNTQIPQ